MIYLNDPNDEVAKGPEQKVTKVENEGMPNISKKKQAKQDKKKEAKLKQKLKLQEMKQQEAEQKALRKA